MLYHVKPSSLFNYQTIWAWHHTWKTEPMLISVFIECSCFQAHRLANNIWLRSIWIVFAMMIAEETHVLMLFDFRIEKIQEKSRIFGMSSLVSVLILFISLMTSYSWSQIFGLEWIKETTHWRSNSRHRHWCFFCGHCGNRCNYICNEISKKKEKGQTFPTTNHKR